MLNILKAISIVLISGLILLISNTLIMTAFGDEVINVDELKINYKSFFVGGRDPLITGNGLVNRQLDKELALDLNTSFMSYIYWNSEVHSMTDKTSYDRSGQFRTVGLKTSLGIRLTKYMDIGYAHHSQHLLDTSYPTDSFPVNDSIEINIYLINHKKFETMF